MASKKRSHLILKIMKLILIINMSLISIFAFSQRNFKDTIGLKTYNIETVNIIEKDYKKINIFYDLEQKTNTRYMSIPHDEVGLKFNNSYGKNGRISEVVLFFHKTDRDRIITNLEINFYKINSNGSIGDKINKNQILYLVKNKSRQTVKINVLKNQILFPKEGVLVAVKWLPLENGHTKVGPTLRMTAFSEELTYQRFANGKWHSKNNIFTKNNVYTNLMMGINAYFKKNKNE